jgi:UDP-GlcNAc:undecaprenyl-phosphate GlcNAc-1-phosphate transferase
MIAQAFVLHALFAAVLFLISAALTWVMIRVNIPDIPVDRSSHVRPTPKSGGVAIASTFLLGIVTMYLVSDVVRLPEKPFVTFLLLATGMLLFALRDDLRPEPILLKLAVQVVCAGIFGFFVADVPWLVLPGLGPIAFGAWGPVVAMVWIVFFTNAFNFMDGLNGLASAAAIVAAIAFGAIAYASGAHFVYLACICLAAATAGFFVFNFPNGRIFLGETGSQVLGFVLAGLAVIAARADRSPVSILVLPVLFYPFIFDVVLTLCRRLLRRENIFLGHREHIYQLLSRAGLSHARVTLIYVALIAACAVVAGAVQVAPPPMRLPLALAPLPFFCFLAAAAFLYIRHASRVPSR